MHHEVSKPLLAGLYRGIKSPLLMYFFLLSKEWWLANTGWNDKIVDLEKTT